MGRTYALAGIGMLLLGVAAIGASKSDNEDALSDLEAEVFGPPVRFRLAFTRGEMRSRVKASMINALDKRYDILLAVPGDESLYRFKTGLLRGILIELALTRWFDELDAKYDIYGEGAENDKARQSNDIRRDRPCVSGGRFGVDVVLPPPPG